MSREECKGWGHVGSDVWTRVEQWNTMKNATSESEMEAYNHTH